MIKKNRNIMTILVFLVGFTFINFGIVSAIDNPTINVDPIEPEQLSSITFTANFDEFVEIEKVYFIFNECDINNICYLRQNKSMTNIGNGHWEITVNLQQYDAAYIQYWVQVKTTEDWQKFEDLTMFKTNLKVKQDNGQNNGDNNNGSSGGTPGFEIISLFLSVILIILFTYTKKDKK